jgi:hypothetical protein
MKYFLLFSWCYRGWICYFMLMLTSYLFTKDLTLAISNFQFTRSNIPSATGDVVYVSDFILLIVPSKVIFGHIFCWQKGTQTRLRCSWVELIYSIYTNMHRSSSRAGSLSYLISTRVLLDLTISNMRLFYKKQELLILLMI